jgi:hypothetical protein
MHSTDEKKKNNSNNNLNNEKDPAERGNGMQERE